MKRTVTTLICAAMLLCACEKELDFDYHEIQPITVIEGSLDQYGASVAITLTTPMDEPMDTVRLTDADVTLTDLSDGSAATLLLDSTGTFRSTLTGHTGHTYRLDVTRLGSTYSATCTMPAPSEILSMDMEWIKMPYDHVAVLKVTFTDNPHTGGDAYWLRIYRNGEPYHWSVGDDRAAVNGEISAVFMTSRRDTDAEDDSDLLLDGDVLSATLTPISRQMYLYLEALTSGGSNGPLMYQGDFCLGYFLAAPTSRSAITFRPDSLPGL